MTSTSTRHKITTLSILAKKIDRAKSVGECIVFTNGCFDLLHVGHVRSLEQARRLGDRLVVAINSDASVRRSKGADRPILPARTRMELVAALECVDWVIGFRADTPIQLIRTLGPNVLAKGGDWPLDSIVGAHEVKSHGGRVVRLKIIPVPRTSDLIERIRKGSPRQKR
jgi:D-beta-D-heptose 7-phosphate kinase/D-beta-D-heptose 1-phosphate adenosyltransferase